MSAFGGKADNGLVHCTCPLMTQGDHCGRRTTWKVFVLQCDESAGRSIAAANPLSY